MSSNYPPGVTGFEPEIAGAPEIEPDAFVDRLLTADERKTILDGLVGTNMHGAHVRDLLAIMYDADYYCDRIDPIAEAHRAAWSPEHTYAALALALVHGPDGFGWPEVYAFLERANDEIFEEGPDDDVDESDYEPEVER